ncbi:hypothetical protein B0T26DRAFT_755535 [Lasiosphaeria miniovina]|uniref:Prion-inhibition and propagation HeLo domain-containing protein n=1 Tax=Lasiosphaeria miniovina TaxID=1954250 RepID=A0AA39ZYG5_9PEZI|nr:uncharacterized protein B0T26DRAFT_755535 [Lasiosphaeria miniovina]KAK0705986.1 hypothetical protein B0T26DRAFT_755535 [Lasiosphaeria miniovina]
MVDVVRPALQAIPAAYKAGRLAWEFYQTSKNFGRDFDSSQLDLRCQEWTFAGYLKQYNVWVSSPLGGRSNTAKEVGKKIASMVKLFNKCYDIIRKYNRDYQKEETELAKTREEESAMAAWGDIMHRALAKRLAMIAEEKKAQFMIRIGDDQITAQPGPANAPATAEEHLERLEADIEAAQKRAGLRSLLLWAANGKDEFEKNLRELRDANEKLGDLIPSLVEKDPFLKIRQSTERPKLSDDVRKLRTDLENLDQALRRVNSPDGGQPVVLAVKIEDPSDTKSKMQGTRYVRGLNLGPNPMYLLTMETSQTDNGHPEEGLIFVTTLSGRNGSADGDIQSLPQKLAVLITNPPSYRTIGTVAVNGQLIFHLQRVRSPLDTVVAQNLSALISHAALQHEQRVFLASQIALAHQHFLPFKSTAGARRLRSFHLCGPQELPQELPKPQPQPQPQPQQPTNAAHPQQHQLNWTVVTPRPLYAEFGLGREQDAHGGEIPGDDEFAATNLDPTAELGLLLYQLESRYEMPEAAAVTTVAEMRAAHDTVRARLRGSERTFNLYMREVVETCFLELEAGRAPGPDRVETTVLEVEWALRRAVRVLARLPVPSVA